jgi:hypothetical protein
MTDVRTDYVVLGGQLTPGRAVVKGFGSPRIWDKRKGYGTSGATQVYAGEDLSNGSIEVSLWDEPGTGQWLDWEAFARKVLVKEPKGPAPKALKIEHWALNTAPLQITDVVVKDVTQFGYNESEDLWQCEIKLERYNPPKPALGKPNGSSGGSKINSATEKPPTAQDKADEEIAKLLKQFQEELAKG